jgi:D-alanyl-D-alanine carboxypeptidase (penicillin-binding protein 5/6)
MRDHPIFHDPAGLDGTEGFEGGNRVSAWDLATAARDLMANPELAMIVRMHRLDFTGPDHVVYGLDNQNLYFLDTYPGAIGVKTGLTDAAGFCVAEEAQRGARRMLAIVLNGASSYQTAADLLNKGFATPAGTEPTADELPAVAEPEPVYISHVASHRFANGGLDVSPVAVPEPPSVFHAFGRRLTSSTGVGVECAVGVGVVVVVTSRKRRSRKLRSRRRRPVGAHSRR